MTTTRHSLLFAISLILLSPTSFASSMTIEFGTEKNLDVFSQEPWENETNEMFKLRRRAVTLCAGDSTAKRSDFTGERYSRFYDCFVTILSRDRYPLNDRDRERLKPKAEPETPEKNDEANPGDKGFCISCGDRPPPNQ